MRARSVIASGLAFSLLAISTIVATGFSTPVEAAGLAPCSDTAGASNVTVTASHGQVFYIDSAAGQNLDASYVGYQVSASSAKTNLWARVDTFKGGVVSLANPNDADYNLGDISSGSKKTAYFLMKATSATVAAQTHTIRIYSGKPGLASSTEIRSCTFSFLKVKETIKANPNKVTAVTTTPTNTSGLTLGSTFTVKVTGDTGTIGSGSSPDNSMIWLSPSARSSWPTNALRLESSEVKFASTASKIATDCKSGTALEIAANEGNCLFTNQLLISDLLTKAGRIQNNAKSLAYEATYTFRVVGKTSSAVPVIPVSQISSGTQIKHTPIPASALNTVGVNSVSINATATKSVGTTATISGSDTQFSYKVTVTNNGSSAVSVDQVTDTPDAGLTYVSGTASLSTFSSASGGSATSTTTPNAPSLQTGTTNQIFSGPFSVPAGGRIELSYRMSVATCALSSTYSYTNSATATIGSLVIGSQPSTFSSTAASGSCGTTTVTGTTTNQVLPIEVATLQATSIANTSATLNGTVDPNGQSGQAITFEYGQSASLSTFTSVSAGTTTTDSTPYSVTNSLTGLTSGTVYYFRIKVGSSAGQIFSFVTTEPTATPTITTDPASNIVATSPTFSGVLNATIDPNQTTSSVTFTFSKTSSTLTSGTYTARLLDDPTLAFNSNNNPATVFTGAFSTQVSLSTTDVEFSSQLSVGANDTVYYRANVLNGSGTLISSGVIRSFTLAAYANQTITFDSIADKLLTDSSVTLSPSTDAPGLSVTLSSATPTICSLSGFAVTYLSEGNCTIEATQAGGRGSDSILYYAADPVVQTFLISKASQTVSFTSTAPNAAVFGSDPYLVTGSATSGLTAVITSATPLVCTVSLSGAVTYVSAGICTLNVDQSGNNSYSAATQVQQSFTIDRGDRSLTAITTGVNSDAWGTVGRRASAQATADDEDSKSYFSVDTSICTVGSDGSLTLLKPGECSLYSTISQGGRYKAKTSNTVSFTVGKKDHTLTGSNRSSAASAYAISMAVTSDATTNNAELATTTYSIESGTNTAGCSVDSSGLVTFASAGECFVLAENTGNAYWKTGTARHSLTLSHADRTLTASTNGTNNIPWGTTERTASATASDDDSDSKTYFSSDATVCSVDNSGNLTLHKPGTCSISATVAQGNRYKSANSNTVSFTVGKKDHTLTGSNRSSAASAYAISMAVTSDATTNNAELATTTYSIESGTNTAGCSVDSSGLVTFASAGECFVLAENTGNAYWKTGTARHSLTLSHADRTLTASTNGTNNIPWGTTERTASATASDDDSDSKTYFSSDATVCSVDNSGNLTLHKPGTCSISATVAQGNRYKSANSNTVSFTVGKKDHTLTGIFDTSVNVSEANISMAASSQASENIDGLALTSYEISGTDTNSANCAVDPSTGLVTWSQSGECSIVATNTGNDYWKTATTKKKLTVNNKLTRTLNLTTSSPTTLTWKANGKSVVAGTEDDNNDNKSYISVHPDVCTVNAAGVLTFLRPGTCEVSSTIAEGARFNSAVSNSITFTVEHEDRNLNLTTTATNSDTWGFTGRSASANAGDDDDFDPKTYQTLDSDVCTVDSEGNLTLVSPGTCSVTASIARGNRFKEKTSNTVSFQVAKKAHALNGSDKVVDALTTSLAMSVISMATTNNGDLASTSYSIEAGTNTAGCSVDSSGTATFTSAGTCFVVASNSGNSFWANGASRHKITVERVTRTLRAETNASNGLQWGATGKSVSATASADDLDGKTFSALNPAICTVDSAGNLTLLKSGTCSVTATVVQGNRYNSAVSNTVSFEIAKKDQTLSGMTEKTVNSGDGSVVMSATTTSGLTTTRYSVTGLNTAGCTVNQLTGRVTFTKSGECQVTASNSGDERWSAALPLTKKIIVRELSSPKPTPTPSPTSEVVATPTPQPSNSSGPEPTSSPSSITSPTPSPSISPSPGGPIVAKGVLPKALDPVLALPSSLNKITAGPATVDLGNGNSNAFNPEVPDSANAGRRTINQLAAENLKGFSPSSSLIIEIIGARTSGQFVVGSSSIADPVALSKALDESTQRNATDFSKLSSAALVGTPSPDLIIGGKVTSEASYLFTSSNLGIPITVGELDIKSDTRWVRVDAQVETYKPGSVVYLAVTTQPIIIGAAIVSKSGSASFSGYIPVNELSAGGHNVRVVGMRELPGVSTDADGQVLLSDATLEEIQRFDPGTVSTVKVSGFNPQNGSNLVIRQIELLKYEPWWTVWLVTWTALLIAIARRYRKIESRKDVVGATIIMLIAMAPALILGWTTFTYAVMGFGTLSGLAGIMCARFLPIKRQRHNN